MPGWNPLVPEANRHRTCPNRSNRPSGISRPSHIVVHITGTGSTADAHNTFMNPNAKASPHYMIEKDGTLHQYVPDDMKAWHSGIASFERRIYDRGTDDWKNYLRHYSWYRGYPPTSVYLNSNFQEVSPSQARYVAAGDGGPWDKYRYFSDTWGKRGTPVGYEISKSPNDYSIGIELVSWGSPAPDAGQYTPQMYRTLDRLVASLCATHAIPRARSHIVGHEDVHPIDRFGWDPNRGFDWQQIV